MRILLALLLAAALSGCGADDDRPVLTVLAAASLKEAFEPLAEDFEDRFDVEVRLVLGSSATLAEQVRQGAPGDVLVTADRRTMDVAAEAESLHTRPEHFASNVLVVAVPRDDAAVARAADLGRAGTDYVTCVPTAPCGAAAARLVQAAGVDREPVSEEPDVKAVVARVLAGETDAGIVYRTDVVAARAELRALDLPGAEEDPNTYWAASTAAATDRGIAASFLQELTSEPFEDALVEAGFLLP